MAYSVDRAVRGVLEGDVLVLVNGDHDLLGFLACQKINDVDVRVDFSFERMVSRILWILFGLGVSDFDIHFDLLQLQSDGEIVHCHFWVEDEVPNHVRWRDGKEDEGGSFSVVDLCYQAFRLFGVLKGYLGGMRPCLIAAFRGCV